MWKRLFRREDPRRLAARKLYAAIVAQARQPAFYARGNVPDTFMGRFAMVALHVILVLRRLLREEGEETRELARLVQEEMFAELDGALREMGVSDLAVPKRMRKLAEAFHGQLRAYDDALLQANEEALAAALARNVWQGEASAESAAALAAYIMQAQEALNRCGMARLAAGDVAWPPPYDPYEGQDENFGSAKA